MVQVRMAMSIAVSNPAKPAAELEPFASVVLHLEGLLF